MSGVRLQWADGIAFAPQTEISYQAPPDTVVYAIGDIHGSYDLLEAVQAGIALDAARRRARRKVIVYLGDYLSRGRDSREVLERVRTWRPPGCAEAEIVLLKGNHEDMALRFLEREFGLGRHWLESGGMLTLASYGVEPGHRRPLDEETMAELRGRFAEAIPPEHLELLLSLKTGHREGGYHFAHAGVRPGVALGEQSDYDQMWIKYTFLESKLDHGAMVVHGHMNVARPQLHANRIAIDTAAYRSGMLTCLVLEEGKRDFLQTSRY
jgi:serine/threonine protein phosphatase 1